MYCCTPYVVEPPSKNPLIHKHLTNFRHTFHPKILTSYQQTRCALSTTQMILLNYIVSMLDGSKNVEMPKFLINTNSYSTSNVAFHLLSFSKTGKKLPYSTTLISSTLLPEKTITYIF